MADGSHTTLGTLLDDPSDSGALLGNQTAYYNYMPSYPDAYFISDEATILIHRVMLKWIQPVLGYVGVVNNILTLIVFSKMGYKETANITLTAIAFWDLVKCTTISLRNLDALFLLFVRSRNDYFSFVMSYSSITGNTVDEVSLAATHVSSALAAYVAIERSICVTMPFTVRYLLTRKFVTIACVTISVLVVGSYSMNFYRWQYAMIQVNNVSFIYKTTHYGSKLLNGEDFNYELYTDVLVLFYPSASLIISIVCSIIIIIQLKKSSKLRSSGKKDGSNRLSPRDAKIAKMLLVIIFVYMVYAFPWVIYHTMFYIYPDIFYSYYYRLIELAYWYTLVISAFNPFVNIYIFFFMSSEFNRTLKQLFHLPVKAKHIKK